MTVGQRLRAHRALSTLLLREVVMANAPILQSPRAPVRLRARMPLWIHVRLLKRDRHTDDLHTVEFLWCSRKRWERWAASHDTSTLDVLSVGPFVVAIGLDG